MNIVAVSTGTKNVFESQKCNDSIQGERARVEAMVRNNLLSSDIHSEQYTIQEMTDDELFALIG